jgi:hypothetical protein
MELALDQTEQALLRIAAAPPHNDRLLLEVRASFVFLHERFAAHCRLCATLQNFFLAKSPAITKIHNHLFMEGPLAHRMCRF